MKRVLVAIPYKDSLNRVLKARMIELAERLESPGYQLDVVMYENEVIQAQVPFAPHATARNMLLREHLKPEHDLVMWIDADLVYYRSNIIEILDRANPGGITAPQVLIEGTGQFYDTYGFVEDGKHISHIAPYFKKKGYLIEMDAVGCAYLAPASLYHEGVRYQPTMGQTEHYFVCQEAQRRGVKVACLATMTIYHADLPKYGESFHGH